MIGLALLVAALIELLRGAGHSACIATELTRREPLGLGGVRGVGCLGGVMVEAQIAETWPSTPPSRPVLGPERTRDLRMDVD